MFFFKKKSHKSISSYEPEPLVLTHSSDLSINTTITSSIMEMIETRVPNRNRLLKALMKVIVPLKAAPKKKEPANGPIVPPIPLNVFNTPTPTPSSSRGRKDIIRTWNALVVKPIPIPTNTRKAERVIESVA